MSYAMLLDGGFVRRKLGTKASPVDAAGIAAFTARVQQLPCLDRMRLHRIYYYDARPLEAMAKIPLGGGIVDFGASSIASRNKSCHWDPEVSVWYVAESDVPGLVTEAPTLGAMEAKLTRMIPELLELNEG